MVTQQNSLFLGRGVSGIHHPIRLRFFERAIDIGSIERQNLPEIILKSKETTGTRLGLALAAVRFAALAALRALGRFAEFALRSLALLCTFDPFLRLAIIDPRSSCAPQHALISDHQVLATFQTSYQQMAT
jgi:hypothetical protein